jgi:hypothetical protein
MFTKALHWSQSSSRFIHSTLPHSISVISILILSSHIYIYIYIGLSSNLFCSGFCTRILYSYLFAHMHATCPAHFILRDFIVITILGEEYKLRSYSSSNFLEPPIILSSLVQVESSAACSQRPSVCVPPLVSETKFHTYAKSQAKL